MRAYSMLRKAFLVANPVCQVCQQAEAVEVHHRKKRGIHYLDVDSWLATCMDCHRRIHANPSWAREKGWLE